MISKYLCDKLILQHFIRKMITVSDTHHRNPLRPLCTFGVITDIHYADTDDSTNYERTRVRYFRRSLDLVKSAVVDWLTCQTKVEFILQLGDLIDGRNMDLGTTIASLCAVQKEFGIAKIPVFNVIGNHELYNFSRKCILNHIWLNPTRSCSDVNLVTPSPGHTAYYHFSPTPGFRLIVLDEYELSVLGYDEDSDSHRKAQALLMEHNKNADLNSPSGLKGDARRFVKFNGGISSDQLNWLADVLRQAQADNELVLVAGHVPLDMKVSDNVCLCWNYKDIVELLHRHTCVVAYFAGHAHDYAYERDSKGLHHITFPGVIETLPRHDAAHATVALFPDRVTVLSRGGVMPDSLELTRRS